MDERRQYRRHPVAPPVSVSSLDRKDRVGVTRDVSAGGILFHGVSRFAPGELLTIRLVVAASREHLIVGQVIRTFRDVEPHHLFRHVCAIRFNEPVSELDRVA